MNRICLTKDGKLIEMQSGGDDREDLMEMRLNTLKQNALNVGYKEDEIEVKWVTDEEWAVIQEAQKDPIVEWNRPILSQITALDSKRLRPLAEGDTEYLKALNEQIIALRKTLRK
jgi:hypothetical protein